MGYSKTTEAHDLQLQRLLDAGQAGDQAAYESLLAHAADRLRQLARRMLRGWPDVRRWEMTDDLLQNALLRLHRCLTQVQPASVADFFRLATVQIRRELLDLAKRHRGPESMAANHHTDAHGSAADDEDGPLRRREDASDEPMTLEGWAAFHEAVEALAEEEQAVVNLLWYENLTQEQAAAVLGLSLRTLKRRWQTARLRLFEALGGEPPRC